MSGKTNKKKRTKEGGKETYRAVERKLRKGTKKGGK